jgi:hypothetical protein
MKIHASHVLLLALTACLGLNGSGCRAASDNGRDEYPYAIPIELTQVHLALDTPVELNKEFMTYNSVVLDELRGTTDHLMEGGSYVACGHYKLSSLDEANLYVGLTNGRIEGDCARLVTRGEGTFRIPFRIASMGDLHVSFYPAHGGEVVTTAYYQEPSHAR